MLHRYFRYLSGEPQKINKYWGLWCIYEHNLMIFYTFGILFHHIKLVKKTVSRSDYWYGRLVNFTKVTKLRFRPCSRPWCNLRLKNMVHFNHQKPWLTFDIPECLFECFMYSSQALNSGSTLVLRYFITKKYSLKIPEALQTILTTQVNEVRYHNMSQCFYFHVFWQETLRSADFHRQEGLK